VLCAVIKRSLGVACVCVRASGRRAAHDNDDDYDIDTDDYSDSHRKHGGSEHSERQRKRDSSDGEEAFDLTPNAHDMLVDASSVSVTDVTQPSSQQQQSVSQPQQHEQQQQELHTQHTLPQQLLQRTKKSVKLPLKRAHDENVVDSTPTQ
jgi:hypothetical protein